MSVATSDPLRRVVLDVAVAIARDEGPDAISLRKVARDAGVSHQAPYHHFGDRAGIFAAIAEEGFSKLSAALINSHNKGISGMCETYVRFALEHAGHFRVMMRNDLCDLQNYPSAVFQADRAFNLLLEDVTAALGNSASDDDIKTHTAFLWSVGHGLATLLLDGPLEKKLEGIADVNALIQRVARLATSSFPQI
jgi:AcrR family transcriptional regulator